MGNYWLVCIFVCMCVCGGGEGGGVYVYVYTCINSYCLLGVFVAKLFVQHGKFN